MRKLFSTLLLVLATFSFLSGAEPGSKGGTIRIRLSRDSQVGTVVIQAGDYKVRLQREQTQGPIILRMTSASGKTIDLSVSEEQSPKQASTGQAYTFSGTTRVLAKIWFKGETRVYNVTDTAVASK